MRRFHPFFSFPLPPPVCATCPDWKFFYERNQKKRIKIKIEKIGNRRREKECADKPFVPCLVRIVIFFMYQSARAILCNPVRDSKMYVQYIPYDYFVLVSLFSLFSPVADLQLQSAGLQFLYPPSPWKRRRSSKPYSKLFPQNLLILFTPFYR